LELQLTQIKTSMKAAGAEHTVHAKQAIVIGRSAARLVGGEEVAAP
jgi:hypothetical protein